MLPLQIYKSERFIVTGNIGIHIVITDLHEDKGYIIERHELIKFRKSWYIIQYSKRDIYLLTIIAFKSGRSYKQVAQVA